MPTIQYEIQGKKNPCMIYLRLSIAKGQVFKRKTGRLIQKEFWSDDTHLPKPKRDVDISNLKTELTDLQAHIYKMYDFDHAKGVNINGDWLTNCIDKFFNREKKSEVSSEVDISDLSEWCKIFLKRVVERGNFSNKGRVNPSTVKKYNTIVSKLERFQEFKNKKYNIRDVNLSFRHDFLSYLTDQERINSNTAGRYIKFVKTIILDARKNGLEVSPLIDEVKGFTVKSPKVTLSFEELETIKSTLLFDEKLAIARDWLIISCYLGQRASDLFRINSKMIYKIEGFEIIVIEQQKTGKEVEIPIHFEVKKVLNKYKGEFPPIFCSEPESNKTLYNRYVKQVCKIAGLNSLTLGNLRDNESGRHITAEYEKYRLVSSHIGRRSFATNFYGEPEYPTPLLMSVTGHTTEQMFLEYIGKKPVQYALQLAKVWALKNKNESINNQFENIA